MAAGSIAPSRLEDAGSVDSLGSSQQSSVLQACLVSGKQFTYCTLSCPAMSIRFPQQSQKLTTNF